MHYDPSAYDRGVVSNVPDRSIVLWLASRWGAVAVTAALLVGCGGDSSDSSDSGSAETIDGAAVTSAPVTSSSPESTTAPATTAPATTTMPATDPATTAVPASTAIPDTTAAAESTAVPATTVLPSADWIAVDPGDDCICADGSDFTLFERVADPTKVVLFFDGGGACFSAETCSFTDGSYTPSVSDDADSLALRDGIFDFANPDNPFADYSFVVVPYCTGDVHIGNATTDYSDDLTVRHNGFINATAGLDEVIANYPEVEQLVVAGVSAGSVPTPLFAGLATDRLDGVDVLTLGDSSGAYPDNPAINAVIGNLWGTTTVIPDWPETAGITAEQWSIPGLYVFAGMHAPEVRLAQYDHAFDEVQTTFNGLVGVTDADLVTIIDDTQAEVAATGVEVSSYVAPGDQHTILLDEGFYTLEVTDVGLVEWVNRLLGGERPDDVHCEVCGP